MMLQTEYLFNGIFSPPAVQPFASAKEFEATAEIVKKFKEGIGKELHQKLLQRAKKKRNWVCCWAKKNPCFVTVMLEYIS